MIRFGSLVAAYLLMLCMSFRASGEALRSIDMDSPDFVLKSPSPNVPNHGPVIVDRPGTRSITTTFDTGTKYRLWRTDDGYRSPHGIGLRIDREVRSTGASEKSKIEINVARHDENDLDNATGHNFILRDGTVRYLGFAMRLDGQGYEAPKRWVLHFQVWQCCGLWTTTTRPTG